MTTRGASDRKESRLSKYRTDEPQDPTQSSELGQGQEPTTPIRLPIPLDDKREAKARARMPRVEYKMLLEHSLASVAHYVYDEEFGDGQTIASFMESREHFAVKAVDILGSIPRLVLELLIGGNLFRAVHAGDNEELNKLFARRSEWMLRADTRNTPGIYVRGLVDSNRYATSPFQWREVAAVLSAYVSGKTEDFETAAAVDNISRGTKVTEDDTRFGYRRYLNGSATRATQVITFCQGLNDRLDEIPNERNDIPLDKAFMYVGYSADVSKPSLEYEQGTSSWFQYLVLAALRLKFPDSGFFISKLPVCFLWKKKQANIAEVLLTVATDSMYITGGGLSVTQAGLSTASSKMGNVSTDEQENIWQACREWRDEHTGYNDNLKRELETLRHHAASPPAMTAYERRIQQMEQEIGELERELAEPQSEDSDPEEERFLESLAEMRQPDSSDAQLDSDTEMINQRFRTVADILQSRSNFRNKTA